MFGTLKAQIYAVVLAAVLATVLGTWLYVRHLRSEVMELTLQKAQWESAAQEFERQMKAAKLQAEINDATTTVVQNERNRIAKEREGLAAELAAALGRMRQPAPARSSPQAILPASPGVVAGPAAPVNAPGTTPGIAPDADQFVQQLTVECVAAASDADENGAVIRGWQSWYREQKRIWETAQ